MRLISALGRHRRTVGRTTGRMTLVVLLLVAGTLLTPSAAEAAPDLSITVSPTATLLDPTLVQISVQITCAPMEVDYNQGRAELRQASGGRIAFGDGFEDSTIICDGTPHPNSYLVWVDTASAAPFRTGTATVRVSVYLCSPVPVSCQSGGSGFTVIRIVRPR